MKLNVIHASAVGLAACAAWALLFPAALLRGLGVYDETVALLGLMRIAGVIVLALAAVLWSARSWLLSPAGAPTLRVLAVIHGVGAVMLLGQQVAAGRLLESAVPILFVAVVSLEYAGTAKRYSRRFGATA
jgi:hypothetical protein